MKVELNDFNAIIAVNHLQEVKSSKLFNTKMTFDPDGLLSNEIFGTSKNDRRNTFAYIDLGMHFIHPHIYKKVLQPMYRNVTYIISGLKRYSIVDHYLQEDPNGWTGIKGLYDHWDEIDWSKSKSVNDLNKQLLTKLSRDQVFTDKFLVCPPAYRDVTLAGTVDSSDYVNECNRVYQKILNLCANLKEGGLFARTQYASQMKVEESLVELYDYFKNLISRKTGLIRHNLIGKSVDYGMRTVISAPTYDIERLEDCMVDLDHSAVPISQCCSLFYPFIEAWVKNFFTREIINDPNMVMYYDPNTRKEYTAILKDPETKFSDKKIRKMINNYCLNPDNRFAVLTVDFEVPNKEGKMVTKTGYIMLKGQALFKNNVRQTLNRFMTITDLLYLACVDCCEKRHIEVSRYPVGTDKGIYFAKVRVQSTAKHINLIFNGKEYPYYPDIDLNTPEYKVGTRFIDTLVMSNSHLDGMGKQWSVPI